MYLNDFDQNGSVEGVLTFTAEDGRDLPYALRHDLIDQMKGLKKKFPDYASFRDADITTIFDEQQRSTALIQAANNLLPILINEGNFNFTWANTPGSSAGQYMPFNRSILTTMEIKTFSWEEICSKPNLKWVFMMLPMVLI